MKHRFVFLAVAVLAIALFLLKAPCWAWALLFMAWVAVVAVGSFHLQWQYHLPVLFRSAQERSGRIAITFDDGPDPVFTPQVLKLLADHGAKATFFCLGRQVERHPELFDRLRSEGHATGHHTWDHPNGWRTPARTYYRSVLRGQRQTGGLLFRPPYGRLKPGQLWRLGNRLMLPVSKGFSSLSFGEGWGEVSLTGKDVQSLIGEQ